MFIVWLLVGIMFGGMAGIFAMCLMVAGAKCDRAMARARKEMERNGYGRRKVIRFVDQFNNSLFSILDGDPIQTINQKGERQFCVCHYLDDTHVKIDGKTWQLQEFAKEMARNDIIYMPLTMRALEAKGGPALLL